MAEDKGLGIYSLRMAAQAAGVSTHTLNRWVKRSFIPRPRHFEGIKVFKESDLKKILEFAEKWPEIRRQERENRLRLHYVRQALQRDDLL